MRKYCLLLPLVFLSVTALKAQQTNLPFNDDYYRHYDAFLYSKKVMFHTDIKPYLMSQVDSMVSDSEVFPIYTEPYPDKNLFRKIINGLIFNHLVIIHAENFDATIDPSANFSLGNDNELNGITNSVYNFTRGLTISGSIGKKFSFNSVIELTKAYFPNYVSSFIRDTLIAPGGAKVQAIAPKSNAIDYSLVSGYISYTPAKYVNFQFGQDKNFIGDGYRSLIFSDNATNYPFFKINTTIWHIKFEDLYMQMFDIQRGVNIIGSGFDKKWVALHYLSWDATKSLQLGVFDAVVWENFDTTGKYRGFDITYLNPLIYLHTAQYNQGSPDNSLIGFTGSLKPIEGMVLYGQLLIDDYSFSKSKHAPGFYGDKYGFQLGAKYYNAFGIKGLYLQSELNQVRPYTYSHDVPTINYAQANQSLADPLGANFREFDNFIGYTYKRFSFLFQFNYALVGGDSAGTNFGHNIFISDYSIPGFPDIYGQNTLQGILNTIDYYQFRFDYLVNPHDNMNVELSITRRTSNSILQNYAATWVMFGIKTNLYNSYLDF